MYTYPFCRAGTIKYGYLSTTVRALVLYVYNNAFHTGLSWVDKLQSASTPLTSTAATGDSAVVDDNIQWI